MLNVTEERTYKRKVWKKQQMRRDNIHIEESRCSKCGHDRAWKKRSKLVCSRCGGLND